MTILMPSWASDIFGWFPWIAGSGLIGYVVLALLAPSVLSVASAWLVNLSPLVKGLAEAIVEITRRLWDGFLDVVDNINTVMLIALVFVGGWWMGGTGPKSSCATDVTCEECFAEIRPDYKFIKRTPAEKEAYLQRAGRKAEPGLFDWLF